MPFRGHHLDRLRCHDSYLATTGQFGDSVPVESVYANSVLFLILGAIALLGWKEAGSHLPAFDSLMPKGKPKMPLLVSSLNLVFFAGVRTASRSPDRRARSMSASAWRTLWHWTVAKPKAPALRQWPSAGVSGGTRSTSGVQLATSRPGPGS